MGSRMPLPFAKHIYMLLKWLFEVVARRITIAMTETPCSYTHKGYKAHQL